MNFKENVLFVLKQRGMTQVEASKRLDVTRQAFQHYLTGAITLRTLTSLADVLDTTPQTLLSEIPLSELDGPIPTRQKKVTAAAFVCPCCGAQLKVIIKGEKQKDEPEPQ